MLPFPKILKNQILTQFWEFFASKTPKQQFCQQFVKMFYPIFSKKSDKLDAFICYKTPKTHLGVLFVQKLQCKIFLKKII